MNKLYLLLICLISFTSFTSFAQIVEPVKFKTSIKKTGETTYDLVINASIEDKWHLYTQEIPEGGPIPTLFTFENQKDNYELIGKVKESKSKTEFDKIFEIDLSFFANTATFTQSIKLKNPQLKSIKVLMDYQACDDEKCIFENTEFTFKIPENAVVGKDNETTKVEINLIPIQNNSALAPEDSIQSEIDSTTIDSSENQSTATLSEKETKDKSESQGFLSIFFFSFLAGFAALLTPCVFPMIPLTVSFFTKQSKNRAAGIRNATLYGVFIIVIYVVLGSIITAIFGADALNALSTSVWFNVIFFVLLVVFAISFLGAFEITLPQSWANKVDSQADRGGILGIFFMALALAIVSFSCTGPIVGGLLVEAASKGGIAPIVGMLGFSLAIALPFTLFAIFPGWLNSLPKSGGWLNTVKVVLGFLELAFAFKFLSQADLVLQGHLLEREVFIAIWIAVFGALALYLFGKIKLPHDGHLEHISVGRLLLGLLTLSFVVYMIPGLWGAPLKLISAFPPPLDYSESPYGVGFTKLGGGTVGAIELPEGSKLMAPHDIISFHDYELGLAYAKKVNKPILIDFTGWACVNCRKMEQNVWPEDNILSIIKNEVVLISLYVDEKEELPESEKYTSEGTGKKIKTTGNKWSDFQITRYKANAQPFYVLSDLEENNLIDPVGYTPDAEEYQAWLRKGIDNFKK